MKSALGRERASIAQRLLPTRSGHFPARLRSNPCRLLSAGPVAAPTRDMHTSMVEVYSPPMNRPGNSSRSTPRPAPNYSDRAYWQGTIKMSLSKFFVLSALHQRPMHGYEVVQTVARMTKGCCSPSEGTVYPMLNEFEMGEYLSSHGEVVQGRERRVYCLTEKGREAFKVAVAAWLEATDCITASKRAAAPRNKSRGLNRSTG